MYFFIFASCEPLKLSSIGQQCLVLCATQSYSRLLLPPHLKCIIWYKDIMFCASCVELAWPENRRHVIIALSFEINKKIFQRKVYTFSVLNMVNDKRFRWHFDLWKKNLTFQMCILHFFFANYYRLEDAWPLVL